MSENKRSKALIRAQKKYEEANREKRNYSKSFSSARSFINKKGEKEDLEELQLLIKSKLKEFDKRLDLL